MSVVKSLQKAITCAVENAEALSPSIFAEIAKINSLPLSQRRNAVNRLIGHTVSSFEKAQTKYTQYSDAYKLAQENMAFIKSEISKITIVILLKIMHDTQYK